MYSHLPFALAQTSIELPYIVIQAVLFATITYWMMELETNPGTLLNLVVYMASKAGLRCATPCCSAACLTDIRSAGGSPDACAALHGAARLSSFCCLGLHQGLRSAARLPSSCTTEPPHVTRAKLPKLPLAPLHSRPIPDQH